MYFYAVSFWLHWCWQRGQTWKLPIGKYIDILLYLTNHLNTQLLLEFTLVRYWLVHFVTCTIRLYKLALVIFFFPTASSSTLDSGCILYFVLVVFSGQKSNTWLACCLSWVFKYLSNRCTYSTLMYADIKEDVTLNHFIVLVLILNRLIYPLRVWNRNARYMFDF